MISRKNRETVKNGNVILGRINAPAVYGMGIGKIGSIYNFTMEDSPIIDLADELEEQKDLLAVGVIDKKGKALGIVTRKDLFGMLGRPFGRDVLRKKTVSSLLSETESFNLNDNIFNVSEMLEERINTNETSYFLLVNDRGGFSGIFSGKDMLVFLAEITRQDIALSRKIQTRIVREEDECSGPAFALSASSVMAKGIGGDFYSLKKISDEISLIILCDVSGKGMAASLLSSLLSGFINTYPIGLDLCGLVSDLNSQLTHSFEGEKFVTGIFALFNSETGRLTIADMGHTHYMRFSGGGRASIPDSQINIPLGISNDIEIKTFDLSLVPGDCFLMMTDGIIEQKDVIGSVYSHERICSVMSEHLRISANGLRARLTSDFNSFRGNAARQDDVSFIILKYSGDRSGQDSSRLSYSKSSIEEKIRWAIEAGKPIQIKTNRYLPEDRDFIDSVLDRFLNEAGIKFLMNKISYCVHELATNAKKANTKRVYFKCRKLDISSPEDYKTGMMNFKSETIDNISFYLDQQKRLGYFIVIMIQLTKSALKITVMNNSEMTSGEKEKVSHKLLIASKSSAIGDVYDQIEDYSEGAGLGIVMMSQMLRTMGFGPDVLKIESDQGLTTASISILLRE